MLTEVLAILALAGSAIAFVWNRYTERTATFADERRRVYTAFLVKQSELQDAYRNRPRTEDVTAQTTPEDSLIARPFDPQVNAARASAWEALAELRLLAPEGVEQLALTYAKRVGRSNPARPNKYTPLPFNEAADLRNAFIEAARADLIPRRVFRRSAQTKRPTSVSAELGD